MGLRGRRIWRTAFGLFASLENGGRPLLEGEILPWCAARPDVGRVRFVGCYCEAIVPGRDDWTIEFSAAKRRHGAKLHIVDSVTNVGALAGRLAAGGVQVVGGNATPERRVIDPDKGLAAVLPRWTFPGWSTLRRVVFASGRHTYEFYTRA